MLPELLRERRISGRDAALATELAYGTPRGRACWTRLIECAERPLSKVDAAVLDALRLGAYQLLRTRIPAHAAVASTVDLVRAERVRRAAGFVNAVLRKVVREGRAGRGSTSSRRTRPSTRSGPSRCAPRTRSGSRRAFADALGDKGEGLAAALEADDARPEVHLVARPGEVSAEELAAITGGDVAPYSPYGVRLEAGAGDPGDLEPVRERLAAVQDEGSQLCAIAVTRCRGRGHRRALARPLRRSRRQGGAARRAGRVDGGTLDAVEKAPHRARARREGHPGLPVTVHVADGRDSGLRAGGYDRVLVDAPCTGLGALRRRPEARWRRQPSDVAELTKLQRELVTAALRAGAAGRRGGLRRLLAAPGRDREA